MENNNLPRNIENSTSSIHEESNPVSLDTKETSPFGDEEIKANSLPTDEYGGQINTSEWLKENTSIHGWLSFFLFALAVGGVISAFASLFTIKPEDYANNFFLICTDVLPGICMLAVAIYTIYAFNARKPNAVFFGKFYVVLVLVTNLLSLIIGDFDEHGLNTLRQAVKGVFWSIIWFLYLINSEQVQEIIPPSFRKVSRRDWWIVAGILLIPVLCFLIGYTQIQNTVRERENNEANLLSVEISEHERSDGRMIFTIPYSFICSQEDITVENGAKIRVYNVENEDIGNCTLCCDYDTDSSRKNFNEYRISWKDDDTSSYFEKDVDEGEKIIDGNPCLYKISSYDINGIEVYWRFMMLFDKATGKVAVLSCYDRNVNIEYIDELLRSIRFK